MELSLRWLHQLCGRGAVHRPEEVSDVDPTYECAVTEDVFRIRALPRPADELLKDGRCGVFRPARGDLRGRVPFSPSMSPIMWLQMIIKQ